MNNSMRELVKIVNDSGQSLPIAIGWDVDNTLIDAPTSPLLHAFIIAHPEIRHCIVTFRTHGMQNRIWRDLSRYRNAPSPERFEAVYNISDEAWVANEIAATKRRQGLLSGAPTPAEIYYRSWKALTCRKHGLSILVDDDLATCQKACEEYAIKLIHPDVFAL